MQVNLLPNETPGGENPPSAPPPFPPKPSE
jgi:hypothetical protein